jgi:branched-chain amino acid transport system substrate-binding protein
VIVSVALLAVVLQACTRDQTPVRVGVLVDCVGFARNAEDAILGGAELPLLRRGAGLRGVRPRDGVTAATVAGRQVALVTGCTEAGEYSTIIEQARRLVEVENVDVVVGGLWPGDGLALREVARRHPRTAFVIATGGPRELTLAGAADNVFRFAADLSQQAAGLGTYAFRDLGWRNAAVIAENAEVGWAGAAAFLAEFCALGGRATQQLLPSFGTTEPAPSPPPSADGVVVFASPLVLPTDSLAALVTGPAPPAAPFLLGPLLAQSPDHLRALSQNPHGVVSVVPAPGDRETQQQYAASYVRNLPGTSETQAMQLYIVAYHDAVEAVMTALERSNGSVGADGSALRRALGSVDANLVGGRVRLDGNRAAVVSTALVRFSGNGSQELIRTVPDVDQTFGGALPSTYEPSSGEQPCRPGTAAPWAR